MGREQAASQPHRPRGVNFSTRAGVPYVESGRRHVGREATGHRREQRRLVVCTPRVGRVGQEAGWYRAVRVPLKVRPSRHRHRARDGGAMHLRLQPACAQTCASVSGRRGWVWRPPGLATALFLDRPRCCNCACI